MYNTRSQTRAASNKRMPLRANADTILNAMRQCREKKAILDREKALAQREEELAQREKALAQREEELAQREEELAQREEAVKPVAKKGSKKGSQKGDKKTANSFFVTYTSHYSGCEQEFEHVGSFPDMKSSIVGTIRWLIQNGKSGFDKYNINERLTDMANDGYESDYSCYLDEDELVEYFANKCNTWHDLREVCDYGDSYFEDEDGWFLRIIKFEN